MRTESITIPVDGAAVESVQGIFQVPARGTPCKQALLLAHGAGASMQADFMEAMAKGLVLRGHPVLRFRYAYMERAAREGRRFPPDRVPLLEMVHRAALETLRRKTSDERVVLAGKSMGGRISSHLAAAGEVCDGLIYLGYPLHPAKKPEKLRSQHFPEIRQRSLFLQGTRDALCGLHLLQTELKKYQGPHQVQVIEGADHAFHVLKRSGRTDAEVEQQLLQTMQDWLS
ncbi:MAG: putative alpha/beta-hydrolase family hydrolase [Candidatus Paceibacteria bacterium]